MKPEQNDWHSALSALASQMGPVADQTDSPDPDDEPEGTPKQKLRVDIEKKGRGGKTATIISGFTAGDEEIEAIASRLKKKLGVGGSARGGEILIQGSRREEVTAALRQMGIIK